MAEVGHLIQTHFINRLVLSMTGILIAHGVIDGYSVVKKVRGGARVRQLLDESSLVIVCLHIADEHASTLAHCMMMSLVHQAVTRRIVRVLEAHYRRSSFVLVHQHATWVLLVPTDSPSQFMLALFINRAITLHQITILVGTCCCRRSTISLQRAHTFNGTMRDSPVRTLASSCTLHPFLQVGS